MKIIVKPSDLVKLCIYDLYTYYVIGSEEKAKDLLLKDEEFELNQNDALVIGLLKIIETDHLVHKFNNEIIHFLTTKSFKYGDDICVRKAGLDNAISKYMNKFPEYWTAPLNYKARMEELVKYIDDVKEKMLNLSVSKVTVKNITYEVYSSTEIKKLLCFQYY